MILFEIYQSIFSAVEELIKGDVIAPESLCGNTRFFLTAGGISVLLFALLFVLEGIGLYKMASAKGMKEKKLAFIPFANLYLMGKLAGRCSIFGARLKKPELWAMITEIIAFAFSLFLSVSEAYLYITQADANAVLNSTWSLTETGVVVMKAYNVVNYVSVIFNIANAVIVFVVLLALLRKYAGSKFMLCAVLSLFISPLRHIFIFAFRNKNEDDYEARMRARYEEYHRAQQSARNYDDPFSEFSSKPKENHEENDDPFGSEFLRNDGKNKPSGGGSDDLFD